ncbi:acyl-CoA dehydrogenase domain protein [Gordonia bronchialis DSM 43247]|jgi:alkylation response protein AidB-like acyl-CoA dehydrogenase|uniref:Acyl-CoA dehydrogenase domain protein n=1 Tax=Gordonia bronchialis (strain ATCC 25592 / DSM 43247 / BCRC 13721 / JCM 3198 / KCTC 3076 / NBRC 16047 / NCTC 10667) TaxID=526226 RepID=D0LD70_GORB4|nr:acyl-CoA dehydrogenase family protein [Gordonia bronchialis]ACY22563.1 acyl-CoA dehydrogenase domain protein [Gordonia bronchialis DSM 43247]MCC3325348.1 acyl-CoA dehydrogenase family protein [Gordonia bronchialis]QGS23948.1 pimeloyl-CoA dehydrogenase small subunit [Gordonia bronchialis]STQ65492.1 Acyl-CoA dehydrogenase, short-chain specific [Gordonia bronchialis]
MDFTLTPEQQLLADGLGKFLDARYDLQASREAVKVGAGWQPEIWRALADELGVIGACLPEAVGGDDGGPEELMVVTEALGHALVVEPFVDSVVLGARLLHATGAEPALAAARRIAAGEAVSALAALEDSSGGVLSRIATSADRDGDGWVINGTKAVVTSAPIADYLIVSARTAGEPDDPAGVSLFLLELGDNAPAGLTSHPLRTIDDRVAADLVFTDVRVPADALIAESAIDLLERAWDEATAAVVSEAVGLMRKVFTDTVEYAKQRQQFGVPIGSFQALQHRMVDMHLELEQSVAAQYFAILSLDDAPAERAAAVSAAKATISRAARFIGQNAVQLHGGMGMTEELAIGHYFKRLTAVEYEFGTADAHLARFAASS